MQLSDWRKSRGISQSELGEAAGLAGPYISQIESGARRPSPDAAKRIEAATSGEVTAAELLGLETGVSKRTKSMAEDAVSFEGNTAVSIPVPPALLEQARAQGLEVEALVAEGGIVALREASKKAWYEENRDVIEANRAHIEKYGTFGQRHGVFRPR
ncbi:MAG: hypothetical protein VR74_11965 [Hyphomonas sp. BRH_c22]|uniref:helix-turn-helix domain-containing protein n=1 Tax=Hyphomonas sp. BRH_c22 TaxID=1629710 RepID=UPI0005F0F76C|nr:helix-turn-helix domain-containing protein [Hyphomonas sp. BRH_c22]KJS36558.1 MAG: hypothetical protein VR74_11965 [Hyphomonas sp. BRH_c22]